MLPCLARWEANPGNSADEAFSPPHSNKVSAGSTGAGKGLLVLTGSRTQWTPYKVMPYSSEWLTWQNMLLTFEMRVWLSRAGAGL